MTIPSWMYRMAQERQAELLREAAEYRRAGPTVLVRFSSRIQRFRPWGRQSRAGVVGPSTAGLVKINLPKRAHGGGEATIAHHSPIADLSNRPLSVRSCKDRAGPSDESELDDTAEVRGQGVRH